MMHDIEIPSHEIDQLKELIKSEPSLMISDLVESQMNRFPDVEPHSILEILSSLAKTDNPINSSKVEAIRTIAIAYGLNDSDWNNIKENLGLNFLDEMKIHLKVLDLHDNPSVAEIKKAYQKKIKNYHPDRYQDLPDDVLQTLHEKAAEIIQAKEYLLKIKTN